MSKNKILLIDDSSTNLILISNILESEGFKTKSVTSGKSALQLLKKELFDLIILDIMMPIMDGFKVLNKIKNNDQTTDIPVIMVTARLDKQDVEKSISEGASAYIKKPFDIDDLIEKVNSLLLESNDPGEGPDFNNTIDQLFTDPLCNIIISAENLIEKNNSDCIYSPNQVADIRKYINSIISIKDEISNN